MYNLKYLIYTCIIPFFTIYSGFIRSFRNWLYENIICKTVSFYNFGVPGSSSPSSLKTGTPQARCAVAGAERVLGSPCFSDKLNLSPWKKPDLERESVGVFSMQTVSVCGQHTLPVVAMGVTYHKCIPGLTVFFPQIIYTPVVPCQKNPIVFVITPHLQIRKQEVFLKKNNDFLERSHSSSEACIAKAHAWKVNGKDGAMHSEVMMPYWKCC